jgi:hypothetical protein
MYLDVKRKEEQEFCQTHARTHVRIQYVTAE